MVKRTTLFNAKIAPVEQMRKIIGAFFLRRWKRYTDLLAACSYQVASTTTMVPNAIMSLCAKFAKRRMPKINVAPRASSASCEPMLSAGKITP